MIAVLQLAVARAVREVGRSLHDWIRAQNTTLVMTASLCPFPAWTHRRRAITQRLHRQRLLRSKASARVGRRFLSSVQASWTSEKTPDTNRAGRSWRICRLSTPSPRHWKTLRNAKEAARAFAIIMSYSTEVTVCLLPHSRAVSLRTPRTGSTAT